MHLAGVSDVDREAKWRRFEPSRSDHVFLELVLDLLRDGVEHVDVVLRDGLIENVANVTQLCLERKQRKKERIGEGGV